MMMGGMALVALAGAKKATASPEHQDKISSEEE
jgi:hypothetical protein